MNYDIANPDLAPDGARRLEWAGRRMPVLKTVRERYLEERPFEGYVIAACLHVTAETANLMLAQERLLRLDTFNDAAVG